MNYEVVLDFWFKKLKPKDRFQVNPQLDQTMTTQFSEVLRQARYGELFQWRAHPHGRLAEIIVLDQFSRNIFRGRAEAFAQDALALILAQEAVSLKVDLCLSTSEKSFLYMPFMHSESLVIHNEAVKLFSQPGLEGSLEFELKHKIIIERFGRYPHRNGILGRESSPEEIAFLKEPDSSF